METNVGRQQSNNRWGAGGDEVSVWEVHSLVLWLQVKAGIFAEILWPEKQNKTKQP